jgi:hypothetical protein
MNDILVIKLSKDGDALNLEHTILENDSQLKAYSFLHKLLACVMEQLRATMPVPPTLLASRSISTFGKDLLVVVYLQLGC